jgi:hypothetical protein
VRSFFSAAALVSLVVACTQSTTPATTSSSNDGACSGKPAPTHGCVGGKRELRCNTLASGEVRWQIDCLRGVVDPNISPTSSIGHCLDSSVCGAEPAWDDADCMWGFVSEPACEKLDGNPCAWSRRCKPKPCTDDDPACNRLVAPEKIGAPCGADLECPSGSSCVTVSVNVGDPGFGPACVTEPVCDLLVCAEGRSCATKTSFPGQVGCFR